MEKIALSEKENYVILFLTIVVILTNYVAYSGAEALLAAGLVRPGSLATDFLAVLAFPIRFYIDLYESRFFIPVPVLGRVVNYLVELGYFVVIVTTAYLGGRTLISYTTRTK